MQAQVVAGVGHRPQRVEHVGALRREQVLQRDLGVPGRLERIDLARADHREVGVHAALRLRADAQQVDRALRHLAQHLAERLHEFGVEAAGDIEILEAQAGEEGALQLGLRGGIGGGAGGARRRRGRRAGAAAAVGGRGAVAAASAAGAGAAAARGAAEAPARATAGPPAPSRRRAVTRSTNGPMATSSPGASGDSALFSTGAPLTRSGDSPKLRITKPRGPLTMFASSSPIRPCGSARTMVLPSMAPMRAAEHAEFSGRARRRAAGHPGWSRSGSTSRSPAGIAERKGYYKPAPPMKKPGGEPGFSSAAGHGASRVRGITPPGCCSPACPSGPA